MNTITTIKVYQKTKVNLERFKEHRRESYDDVLKKLLYLVNLIRQDPELGKKLLEEIELTKKKLEERRGYKKLEPEMIIKQ